MFPIGLANHQNLEGIPVGLKTPSEVF